MPRSFNQLPNNSVLSQQRPRVRVSWSPPFMLKNLPELLHFCVGARKHKKGTGNNSLVFDCLNTELLESLETILHGFEFFGGVLLPIHDLAYDAKRIL